MRSHVRAAIALLGLVAPVAGAQLAGAASPRAAVPPSAAAVIPRPASAVTVDGTWEVPTAMTISMALGQDDALAPFAALAAEVAREDLGAASATMGRQRVIGGIHLRFDVAVVGDEAYRIVIDASGAELSASRPAGMFYALQTLRQLARAGERQGTRTLRVAGVRIDDQPRFTWRGLHLDVGRHFQPVAFVKRYIDLMARFKLNTFHWHLTEDQGWRIEIRRYPRLTSVGGCRAETMVAKNFDPYVGDGTPHCGFYTQDEIRDVVAYAAERHITVVPEIEMPGHTVAALAAYPELACTRGPFKVRTTWGVDDEILCPSERTFQFIEDVLGEVMTLFPSRFIHIGGDEAPKVRWKESPVAQEVMRREGLQSEEELQSWFIQRVERFLNSRGRRLIGWDEILEGGLAPQATVMSWRGTGGGIEAAQQGHDVVMTPTDFLYLDYYQGDPRFEPLANGGNVPLEKVYSFEPVPRQLTPEQARHILGAQGNVWTEYLKTPASIEYQAYPRALALAEITWSPREARDWTDFLARLPVGLSVLDAARVNYRVPHVEGVAGDMLTLEDSVTLTLHTPLTGATIRYTLDGTDPTRTSAAYTTPIRVAVVDSGTRITARAFTREGRVSPPRSATYRRTTHREADVLDPASLEAGLTYRYAEANVTRARAIDSLPVERTGVVTEVARRGDERPASYALHLSGWFRAPHDGMYTFALASDDGSTLELGGRLVVDNDGLHGTEEKQGMIALRAGLHPIVVRYFQAGGGAAFSLRMRIDDGEWQPVDAAMLVHQRP